MEGGARERSERGWLVRDRALAPMRIHACIAIAFRISMTLYCIIHSVFHVSGRRSPLAMGISIAVG